jgi:hypothetical protein
MAGGDSAKQDLAIALREIDIALRLKPDHLDAQIQAGVILEVCVAAKATVQVAGGRIPATLDMALERYRRVLAAQPGHRAALLASGRILIQLKRFEEAAKVIAALNAAGASAEASALQGQMPAPQPTVQAAPAPVPAAEVAPAPIQAPENPETAKSQEVAPETDGEVPPAVPEAPAESVTSPAP